MAIPAGGVGAEPPQTYFCTNITQEPFQKGNKKDFLIDNRMTFCFPGYFLEHQQKERQKLLKEFFETFNSVQRR